MDINVRNLEQDCLNLGYLRRELLALRRMGAAGERHPIPGSTADAEQEPS